MGNEGRDQAGVDIAIIGIGCMFPDAQGAEQYWKNIRGGKDSIREIPATHWKPADYFDADQKSPDRTYAATGGFISPYKFNPLEYGISPNAIEATDTTQLLGMVVAQETLKDAGYGPDVAFDRDRVSCIIGVTGTLELVIPLGARLGHPIWKKALADAGVSKDVADDVVARISDSYVGWQENSFPGLLGNVVAGRIANRLDLGGTNCVVDAACASSLSALHLACLELATGKIDMVITGGFDTFNDIFMYMCFSKTPALSPTGHARPFDRDGDGTILGEGLGAVLIKRLSDAERDGDRIYAVIKSIGTASDGKGQAIYAPSSRGQIKCLSNAYRQADVSPQTVELIEAHGTGTKVGDAVETSALCEVFASQGLEHPHCVLGSVKSQIGHTKAAAGAAGLIKAALALYHKVLPPTIKVKTPSDTLLNSPFYLNKISKPWLANPNFPRRAGVSAFGFGGSNFHCVLEEFSREKPITDWDGDVQVFTYSAGSKQGLLSAVQNSLGGLKTWDDARRLAKNSRESLSFTEPHRLTFVVKVGDGILEVSNKITGYFGRFVDKEVWKSPDNFFYSSRTEKSPVAFLFPGQGAQRINMLSDLACVFPEMNTVLSRAQELQSQVQNVDSRTLSQVLYPPSVYNDDDLAKQTTTLQKTDMAQPAIGAVSAGCLSVLRRFGLRPEFSAGHSFGELTALYSAGCISLDTYLQLGSMRGSLMAKASGKNSGSMLAVRGTRDEVLAIIRESELEVVVANHNSPQQVVLSGHRDQLKKAETLLASSKLRSIPLPVGAAFHSPIVADAERPFTEYLQTFEFSAWDHPVYSNQTADLYPKAPEDIRNLLSTHLVNQVSFVDQILNMYAAGARTFVEIGPGKVLSDLVAKILPNHEDITLVAVDGSVGRNHGLVDLAILIAELSASGHQLKLDLWDEQFQTKSADLGTGFSIELTGANYVKEKKHRAPVTVVQPKVEYRAEAVSVQKDQKILNPMNIGTKKVAAMTDNEKPTQSSVELRKSENLSSVLQLTQQNLLNLQNLQKQSAELHKQFLENQQASQEMFHTLMKRQFDLISNSPGGPSNWTSPAPDFSRPIAEPIAVMPKAGIAQHISPPTAARVAPPANVGASHAQNPVTVQPATEAVASLERSALTARILYVVGEKTGYPADMLELGMNLENDLGIDSIKRVEIFSALHSEIGLTNELRSDELGALSTLNDIVTKMTESASIGTTGPGKRPNTSETAVENRTDSIEKDLFAIIADKTGYPAEMLNLNMELESDLGIDSIKRVEILSALQEKFSESRGISADRLNALKTVREILSMFDRSRESAVTGHETRQGAQATASNQPVPKAGKIPAIISSFQAELFDIVADKTGYPTDMLTLEMNLESDLGIDSIKKVEIFSALQDLSPAYQSVDQEIMSRFGTLGDICQHFNAKTPAIAEPVQSVNEAARSLTEKKNNLFEPSIDRFAVRARAISASEAGADFNLDIGSPVLIAAVEENQASVLVDAFAKRGIAAFAICLDKSASAEIPNTLGGLLVLAPSDSRVKVDQSFLIDSFLLAKRARLALEARASQQNSFFSTVSFNGGLFGIHGLKPDADAITGGLSGLSKTASHEWPAVSCKALDVDPTIDQMILAESIVTQCLTKNFLEVGITHDGLITIACENRPFSVEKSKLPFSKDDVVIITGGARGVTAEVAIEIAERCGCKLILLGRSPLPESEPHWLLSITDPGLMKKAIIKNADQQLTLKDVEEKFQQVLAWREMDANFDRIRATGAKFIYRSVDIQNAVKVQELIHDAEYEFGVVTGIVHGAGVLRDRLIADKTVEQFSIVYGTKIGGLEAIMKAIDPTNLKVLALFSSSTGRYGRKGQVDYAMANEVLNKFAQKVSLDFSKCRVISVNWGPWDGGMVTDSLKKLFDSEGIAVIPLKSGAKYLVDEMMQEGSERLTETVVLGTTNSPGAFVNYRDHTEFSSVFACDVSVKTHPFLASHVIKGRAVVPAAIMIEWLAHAAVVTNPGFTFLGFDDFKVLKGITLGAEDQVQIHAYVGDATRSDADRAIKAEIRSIQDNGKVVCHAKATIILTEKPIDEVDAIISPATEAYEFSTETAYQKWLFHGPSLQGLFRVNGCSSRAISGVALPGGRPSEWMQEPQRSSWLTEPLVLDVAFQLMILWSTEQSGVGCLPVGVKKYRQYRKSYPKTSTIVNAAMHKSKIVQSVNSDIEFVDVAGQLIARMDNYEGIRDRSLVDAFSKRTLVSPESTL
jgi:acyl transferase domain-containing protein/NAD(P)-dependent dehydrogenase (short-subunit alcohol dehydrogenase family)